MQPILPFLFSMVRGKKLIRGKIVAKKRRITTFLGLASCTLFACSFLFETAYAGVDGLTEVAGAETILMSLEEVSEAEWELLANYTYTTGGNEDVLYANEPIVLLHWGYKVLGVADAEDGLCIRKEPFVESEEVGQLPKNAGCEILSADGEWAYISSGKVTGYVNLQNLLTDEAAYERAKEVQQYTATITADSLKVRKEPNTNCGKRGYLKNGEVWLVEEVLDGWVKILYDEKESYISQDYVNLDYTLETAMTMIEVKYGRGVTDVGVAIAEYAQQFVGYPYVWGGTSLTKGTDCSGFTMLIFKKYGVTLTHSARAQAKRGTAVAISELRPGDLVFYSGKDGIDHVTIYIGDNKVVHASGEKYGIRITKLTYRTPTCARRLI